MPSEIEEGVAFYGRSGSALMKSLRRLPIDPLAVYGTLFVKCPVSDTSLADPACLARRRRGDRDRRTEDHRRDGRRRALRARRARTPARPRRSSRSLGEIQQLTPQIAALHVPNIDESLDEEHAKRAFWAAFRVLGDWYEELPPY